MTKLSSTTNINTTNTNNVSFGFVAAHVFFAVITLLIASAAYGFCQNEDDDGMLETMAFYGVYHSDPMNQIIHFIFVPCIFWSLFMITSHLPLLPAGCFVVPALPGIPSHRFTWATLNVAIYVTFYTYIDWVGSLCYFPVLYAMYASAVRLYQADQKAGTRSSWLGTGRLMRRAWMLHALAWYMQIHPGHQWFEGSQPAILQSLGGALSVAPFFAFYEGVWALGLRQDLYHQISVRVEDLRKDLCEKGTKMRRCPSSTLLDSNGHSVKIDL